MPRPHLPPHLVPSQPRTVLGWSMQKLRLVNGWTEKRVASEYGCSSSHISRVETKGSMPSMRLVGFYEEAFNADGVLWSLFWPAECAKEQARARAARHQARYKPAAPGDASVFLGDTVPHGRQFLPGQVFAQAWRVRNSGNVRWVGRRLERQGPLTGPGLITSTEFVEIPDTEPGGEVSLTAPLKAPTYDCTSIAYFKMVDADRCLCFPDSYQLGLDVLVTVRGQRPDDPSLREE